MKKTISKIITVLFVAILALLPIAVMAVDTYDYYMDITVTDTSGTSRTNVVVMTGISPTNLYNAGYILSTGLDTAIKDGASLTSTDLQYYLNSTQTALVLPTLGANQSRTIRMYMGYSPAKTAYPIIVGDSGYITTADAAALEPAADFEIEISGYLDTSAADKYILKKDGALELYTSDVGEITGKIWTGTTASIESGGISLYSNIYGANWAMQSFTSLGEYCPSVKIYTQKYADPSGNFVIGLYATSGGNPTGSALATSTITATSVTADGYYTGTFTTPVQLTNGVVYAIVMNCVSGDAGNYIKAAYLQTANIYAGGQAKTSSNSGSTWSNLNYDFYFAVNDLGSKEVVGTGITSGEHIIKLTADGTNLKLFDGVTEKDSEALAGKSVTNNANNFVWLDDNSVPYADYIKYTVSDTLLITYQPAALYTNPTLNDLTGTAQDGTITWGSNADLDIAVSGVGSYASTVNTSAVYNDSVGDYVTPITQPDNWYATGSITLPFYDTFNSAAASIGMTTQTLYVWVILGLAAGAGIALVVFTGSPMLAAVACGIIIAAGVNSAVLSAWMLYTYILLALGILYVVRQN